VKKNTLLWNKENQEEIKRPYLGRLLLLTKVIGNGIFAGLY
jgi:hypothetical protein